MNNIIMKSRREMEKCFSVQTAALRSDSRLKARRPNNHSSSMPTPVKKAAIKDQYKRLISNIHHCVKVRYSTYTCAKTKVTFKVYYFASLANKTLLLDVGEYENNHLRYQKVPFKYTFIKSCKII